MYKVRIARVEDVPKVTRLAKQFETFTKYVKVNIDHSIVTYTKFLQQGIGAMLMLEKEGELIGGLGCIKFPDIHSGELTAVETFWFVSPEHRGQGLLLLDAFEQWGAANRCKKLAMIHLADSYPKALERLYRMKGYQLVEQHFIKEI